jgi:hypothetical protein
MESCRHLSLPQLQVLQEVLLFHWLHVERAVFALAGVPKQSRSIIEIKVFNIPVFLFTQLPEGLFADGFDMEVIGLKSFNHNLLNS